MNERTHRPPRCAERKTEGDVILVCVLARGHDDPRKFGGAYSRDHRFGLPGHERDALEAVREVRRGLSAAVGALLGE